MEDKNINAKYLAILLDASFLTFLFHELGHCFFGNITAHKMYMPLNGSGILEGEFTSDLSKYIMIAGGPIFTLIHYWSSTMFLKE